MASWNPDVADSDELARRVACAALWTHTGEADGKTDEEAGHRVFTRHHVGRHREQFAAKGRIDFSGDGPDGVGGQLELSATGALQADGTLAGVLTSTTTGQLT